MNGCNSRNSMAKRGRFAASMLAALFMLAQTQLVQALVVPGGIYSGKDVQLDFSGPTSVNRGIATPGYSTTLTNFDAFDVEENVRVVFEFLGSDNVGEGDVSIEVESAPDSGTYTPIPLETCFSNLCGELGPQGGFPMQAGYDVNMAFRITYNQAGDFTVRVSVVGASSGNQFASKEINANVLASNVAISNTGPDTADRGVQVAGFSTLVENSGTGAVSENVYLGVEISGPSPLKEGAVTTLMETTPGSGEYVEVPLVACGINLCGDVSAAGGFAVAAGYSATSAMLNTFSSTGAFVLHSRLVGIDTGTEYASDNWPVEVVSNPSRIVIVDGQSQSATIGTEVATVPLVRVEDAGGAPLKGVDVSFTVVSGDGRIDYPSALTDADGLASPGSWTLGATPGTNELLVEIPGIALGPVVFTAKAMAKSEISVEMSSNASHVAYGSTQEHVIVVTNYGPSPANSTAFSVPMPKGYADGSAHWTCFSVNDAHCPAEGSGSGGIIARLDLPAGASAVFVVSATVIGGDDDTERVTLNAQASHWDDVTPGNNFASVETTLVLSRAGFEAGEPGAGNEGQIVSELGTLDGANYIDLALPAEAQGTMRTVAQGYTDLGMHFAIDEIRAGETRLLLLSAAVTGGQTSWTTTLIPPATTRIAIGLAQGGTSTSQTQLLAVGEGITLDVPLGADKKAYVSGVKF
jgi:hypothetical protein